MLPEFIKDPTRWEFNLDQMINYNRCEIVITNRLGTFIQKYELYKGNYETINENGDSFFSNKELDNEVPRDFYNCPNGKVLMERSERYSEFRSFLSSSIDLFLEEINRNCTINSDQFRKLYLSNIYEKYNEIVQKAFRRVKALSKEISLPKTINNKELLHSLCSDLSKDEILYSFLNNFLITLKSKYNIYLETIKTINSPIKIKIKGKQIALKYALENIQITRENANDIAHKYGYNAKTSGDKLYQYFLPFYQKTNRIGDPGSKKKLTEKIKLFNSVFDLVSEETKGRLTDEIKCLETLLSKNY